MAEQISVKPLSTSDLGFVDQQITLNFMKKFGTATGFNEFCKVAVRSGVLKNCGNGAQKNKQAYGTYLKNTAFWSSLKSEYTNLDPFSKAGMAKQVVKGKGLSQTGQDALKKGSVYGSCAYGQYTIAQLKGMAEHYGIKRKNLEKMSKAELCALVDGLMADGKEFWDLGTTTGASMKWDEYPFRKEEVEKASNEEKYKKQFGLLPQKDKAQMYQKFMDKHRKLKAPAE